MAYGADKRSCFISFLTVDIDKYLVNTDQRVKNRMGCVGSLIESKGSDLRLTAKSKHIYKQAVTSTIITGN